VYVHYSYYGGLLAGMLKHLVPNFKVYYWNCGELWRYLRPLRPFIPSLAYKLRSEWPLRATLKLADHLVTGSPRMADGYSRWYGIPRHKIVVIPNYIDLDFWTPVEQEASGSSRLRVLFVHRLSERKGARALPEIFESIARQVPDVDFLVVGDGPERVSLEGRCRELGIDARFFGWIANSELLERYRTADLLVVPSLEEGFPRVLLEAMATGCPFVATAVGAVPDVITSDLELAMVPRGDWHAFSERAVAILLSLATRERLRRAGLQRVQRFDLKRVVPDYVAMFRGGQPSSW
jgi:glycosyltransferase involved in cell wall biosynthesis